MPASCPECAIPRHLRDDPDPLVQAEIAAITAPVTATYNRRLGNRRSGLGGAVAGVLALIEPLPRGFDFGQMLPNPSAERQDRLRQRPAKLGQPVFDLRRARRKNRPGHHPVAFEGAQGAGQHLLRDASGIALDVVEAARPVAQQHHDEHAPLLADSGEDLADLAAILVQRMSGLGGGHIDVPW